MVAKRAKLKGQRQFLEVELCTTTKNFRLERHQFETHYFLISNILDLWTKVNNKINFNKVFINSLALLLITYYLLLITYYLLLITYYLLLITYYLLLIT